ncbi:MAG TPA: alkaline phosphatase D family protein [Actinokineospora sp.]|nr:alkaline phosphatase D family protein [Actinokineospora sp.]
MRDSGQQVSRRTVLGGVVGAAVVGATAARVGSAAAVAAPYRPWVETKFVRSWISPEWWGNRLQDWRNNKGVIECVAAPGKRAGRTMMVLTAEIGAAPVGAVLSVRTGQLTPGNGFSGFLVGVGAGQLDYRAAVLAHAAGGTNGGLFVAYRGSGTIEFLDHADDVNQLTYANLGGTVVDGPDRVVGDDVTLRLAITAGTTAGLVKLTATATRTSDGVQLAQSTLDNLAPGRVRGAFGVVSHEFPTSPGATYWFRDMVVDGAGVSVHPERATGPVLGTLFSVSDTAAGPLLKMTAQLFPVDAAQNQTVYLALKQADGTWKDVATTTIKTEGYVAQLRVSGWDSSRAWEYRVIHGYNTSYPYYGKVPAAPVNRAVKLAAVNCVLAVARPLDRASDGTPRLAGEKRLGTFTADSMYFPFTTLIANVRKHNPDVLLVQGDQVYESSPTSPDRSTTDPDLDYLYRYYLWLWAFRDLTSNVPSYAQVDDHDVYQGNLWGWSGAAAPGGDINKGGYANSARWVNIVERTQCGHNPDPYDPTPVLRGTGVYYTAFSYGGVSFALLEDRKFKNTDDDGRDANGLPYADDASRHLLGQRQEDMLRAWKSMHPGQPKVILTQTVWAGMQTRNRVGWADYDSNGFPKSKRDLALQLAKDAGALLVSGDQHQGSLVRHGITTYTDGPLQFTPPAGMSHWQRWFEPTAALPNGRAGVPYTGDWTDAFGNRLRVLATVQPKVTEAQYIAAYGSGGRYIYDRALKREGYGIVTVDPVTDKYVLECWSWDTDPTATGATQFTGFPYTLPFNQA